MTRKKKLVKRTEKQTAGNFHYEKVVEDFNIQSDMHIKRLGEELQSIIDALKMKMNETIQSLPRKMANMTIETYINEFFKQREPPAQSEMVKQQKEMGIKVQKKTSPLSTRTQAKYPLLQTPANNLTTPSCFRSFEGTPLLGRDARSLNFGEKPRDMTPCEKISAFQLRMYSEKGSPLRLGNNVSEEMSRKIQDSLRMLMEEEGK